MSAAELTRDAAHSGGISSRSRWAIYALLITIAASMATARIVRLRPADPKSPTPFLSANDRSRWATIRALGDDGTYAIDHIIFDAQGRRARGWHTIDLVRHRGRDGREHYYSSKPTLLPTLLAGEYWLIKQATGANLREHPFYIARLMLLLTNVVPWTLALIYLARQIERLGGTSTAKIFVLACACFGTCLTTYAITLNNHLIAAAALIFGISAIFPIWLSDLRHWLYFAAAGFAFAFVAANELPALSLLAVVAAGLAWKSPANTLIGFVPATLIVAAGAIGTNYLAHADWRPAYAHRHDGPVLLTLDDSARQPLNQGQVPADLRRGLQQQDIVISDQSNIEKSSTTGRWILWDHKSQMRLALVQTGDGSGVIEVRRWDDWYDYEGSYWRPENVSGIDRGEGSPLKYAFHCLIGHHGLLSLTPIWFFSAAGCVLWSMSFRPASGKLLSASTTVFRDDRKTKLALAATTILVSLVVLAFYLTRPQNDRNYGGGTCCLRWLLWLAPLWLLTMLPAVNWLLQRRWGFAVALLALAVSVFSAHYALDNPWSHPWIFDYWTYLGWIKY